jgi:hypothetical protein
LAYYPALLHQKHQILLDLRQLSPQKLKLVEEVQLRFGAAFALVETLIGVQGAADAHLL